MSVHLIACEYIVSIPYWACRDDIEHLSVVTAKVVQK